NQINQRPHRTTSVNRIEQDAFTRADQANRLALQVARYAVATAQIVVQDVEILGHELRVDADVFGSLVRDDCQFMLIRRVLTVALVNAYAMQLAIEARNLGADDNARLRSTGTRSKDDVINAPIDPIQLLD